MVTSISVIKSGGVMMAATSIIARKECLRYWESMSEVTTPILPRKKAMTGSWNTTPMINVNDTKVEM